MKEVYLMPVPWVQLGDLQIRTPVHDGEPVSTWANLRLADAMILPGIVFTTESDFHFSVNDGMSKVHLNDRPIAHRINHTAYNKPMFDELLGMTMRRVFCAELLEIEKFIRGEGNIPIFTKRVTHDVYGQTCIMVPVEFIRVRWVKRLPESNIYECVVDLGHHITINDEWIEKIGGSFQLMSRTRILDKTVLAIINGIFKADDCWYYLDALKPSLPDLETTFTDAIPECDFKKPPPQVTFRP